MAITGAPGGEHVVRRAARMAARTKGVLVGVHVRPGDGLAENRSEHLADQRRLLDELGGEYHELAGDVADALVRFARAENATQIVLGASQRSRLAELIRGSVINRVIRASGTVDVHVISHDNEEGPAPVEWRPGRDRTATLPPRRRLAGLALAVAGPLLLTLVLTAMRDTVKLPGDLMLFLLLVVVVAAVGGFAPAALAAVGGFALANWYFTAPLHTFSIDDGDNLLALVVFLLIAGIVGWLVSVAARRSVDAARARADAETLAGLSGVIAGEEDPLPQLVERLRTLLAADAVAVLRRDEDGQWEPEVAAGGPVPTRPDDSSAAVPLSSGEMLVVVGARAGIGDPDVLRAFASQVAAASERRRLRAMADQAGGLAEANALRTALLAAVSHDLRTPLAAIKAAATSLLQPDVDWPPETRREFLQAIDAETDRLDSLVGNLLDMSRLQTGALELDLRDVPLEEVVPAAIAGLGDRKNGVTVDVPDVAPARAGGPAAPRAGRRQPDRERAPVVATRRLRARRSRQDRRPGGAADRGPRSGRSRVSTTIGCSSPSSVSARRVVTAARVSGWVSPSRVGSSRRWAGP